MRGQGPLGATAAALLLLAAWPALSACAGKVVHPRAVTVVASTDVWGSVARAVTGRHVPVKSILGGPQIDPHSYQATPSDAAALTDAALVVYNGGGYDPWVDQVLERHRSVASVDAYSFATDAKSGGPPPNEHVFYDLNVAKSVATAISDRMAAIDPANAADYRGNAADFCRGADGIAISEHAIASAYPDTGVVATESDGYYLLAASGLVNRTPPAFAAANENETDPTPSDMASVLDLIAHREVSAVLVNPQTSTAAISGLEDAARRAGVPVTDVTETLPDGSDYLSWQRATVDQLLAALQNGPVRQP
ncbi:metal ABC transporter solute-binding protein, Zn/Mn family [Mycobacterium sp. 050134]|uniref:metal ABC transporter solute-binding protein, Zn/Mn family n=1 Tax=Mycobacterium sp. 050134 TaxID=3096111 RepID=UPI002ED96D8F